VTDDRGPWTSAVVLGVATTIGHALSYAFSLVLSRALGPADFGALSALLGLGVVVGVPAAALQTQVARAGAVAGSRAVLARGYRWGWGLGVVLAVGVAALALPLAALLRLDSALGVLLLATGLVPVVVLGAPQGALLGRSAFGLLAVVNIVVPGLRFVAALVAAGTGSGVAGALGLQAAATWFALLVVAVIARPRAGGAEPGAGVVTGPTGAGLLAATSGLVALFVLANADVLLARVYLPEVESGLYAVAAIGARAVFWGSSFVALLVFPRVASGQQGGAVVPRAVALVLAGGGLAALAAVPLAAPALDLLVGDAYGGAAAVVPWFVVLGTLLAVVQLTTYAALAGDRRRFGLVLWCAVAVQSGVVALVAHDSMREIVGVWIAGTAVAALVGVRMAVKSPR
jgi:O-antigen/teichoic acid export membrane protein